MSTWYTEAPTHEWFTEIPISANFTVPIGPIVDLTLSDGSSVTLSDGSSITILATTGDAHPGLWFTEAPSHEWFTE